jgi:hypothetical protein
MHDLLRFPYSYWFTRILNCIIDWVKDQFIAWTSYWLWNLFCHTPWLDYVIHTILIYTSLSEVVLIYVYYRFLVKKKLLYAINNFKLCHVKEHFNPKDYFVRWSPGYDTITSRLKSLSCEVRLETWFILYFNMPH